MTQEELNQRFRVWLDRYFPRWQSDVGYGNHYKDLYAAFSAGYVERLLENDDKTKAS